MLMIALDWQPHPTQKPRAAVTPAEAGTQLVATSSPRKDVQG